MGTVAARGRWVWGLSGVVVIAAMAVPASALVIRAGRLGGPPPQSAVPTKTIVIKQSVTSLDLESYGADISVIGAPVPDTQVIEAIRFDPQDGPPTVTRSVSHGRLTLAAPRCGVSDCSVGFTVTVPEGAAVTAQSDGGQITVSGVGAANLDSGGGSVQAGRIPGPLTVNSEGGPVTVSGVGAANLDSGGGQVDATNVAGSLTVNSENGGLILNGLSGPLDADTGGGPMLAGDVAAVTATVNTEGGNMDIGFITAPQAVTVDTGGGNARLGFVAAPPNVTVHTEGGSAVVTVPGGPYSVTADSGGGPESVGIPTNPTASRSISVDTGGGALRIVPGTGPDGPLPGTGVNLGGNGSGKLPEPATPPKPQAPAGPTLASAAPGPV